MVRDSIYRPIYERNQKKIHLGYDYKDNILKNTLSNQMFKVNKTLTYFIKQLNDILYHNIEAVKQIKTFANYLLDRYENKIN